MIFLSVKVRKSPAVPVIRPWSTPPIIKGCYGLRNPDCSCETVLKSLKDAAGRLEGYCSIALVTGFFFGKHRSMGDSPRSKRSVTPGQRLALFKSELPLSSEQIPAFRPPSTLPTRIWGQRKRNPPVLIRLNSMVVGRMSRLMKVQYWNKLQK